MFLARVLYECCEPAGLAFRLAASIDTQHAFEFALAATGGITGWQQRLTRRAATQASIERTFGPNWRELRAPNTWTCKHPKRQRLSWQGGFRVHSMRGQRRPLGWNARQIRRSRYFRQRVVGVRLG